MDKKIKERFGILIRPTGRFELVQLGTEGEDVSLLDALELYFDGEIEYARNAEGLAYITRDGAFDDGYTRNESRIVLCRDRAVRRLHRPAKAAQARARDVVTCGGVQDHDPHGMRLEMVCRLVGKSGKISEKTCESD